MDRPKTLDTAETAEFLALFETQFRPLHGQATSDSLYAALNQFRGTFNTLFKNYEVILEDDWYKDEGRTTIEYQLRCLDTKEFLPIAVDTYASHQDTKGVWHLGDYQSTQSLIPLETLDDRLLTFIAVNTALIRR